MRFQNRTNNKLLREACIFAHYHFEYESKMMQELKNKNDFKFNSGTGGEIFERFCNNWKTVDVLTYRPLNPLTSARAKWDGKFIHINVYYIEKKSTDIAKAVGSLVHEYCHALGYGHGNNWRTKEKEDYSVPYWTGIGVASGRWL